MCACVRVCAGALILCPVLQADSSCGPISNSITSIKNALEGSVFLFPSRGQDATFPYFLQQLQALQSTCNSTPCFAGVDAFPDAESALSLSLPITEESVT